MTPEPLWATFANAVLFVAILTVPIAVLERRAIAAWWRGLGR